MVLRRKIAGASALFTGVVALLAVAGPAHAAVDAKLTGGSIARWAPTMAGRLPRVRVARQSSRQIHMAGRTQSWVWLLGGGRSMLWSWRDAQFPAPNAPRNTAGLFAQDPNLWLDGRLGRHQAWMASRTRQQASGGWGGWSDMFDGRKGLGLLSALDGYSRPGFLGRLNLGLSMQLAPVLGQGHDATEDLQCIADLIEARVDFQIGPQSTGIRTPVTVRTWNLGGVEYVPYYPDQSIIQMDCRLVRALVRVGPILQSLGVRQVVWSSAYRPPTRAQILGAEPFNKHTEGLAIDIHGFRFGGHIYTDVARNYEKGLGFQRDASCLGRPATQEGFLLRLVACRLDASDLFQEILTPDYDGDHWNHYHLAVFRANESRRHKRTALLEVPLKKIPGWAMTRLGHARPELEIWRDVAKRPWPKGAAHLRSRVMASDGDIAPVTTLTGATRRAAIAVAHLGSYLTKLNLAVLAGNRMPQNASVEFDH